MKAIKLATFKVNGIRPRLPYLLQWLEKESPDIVCLQELKALDASFPIAEIREAGYGRGMARPALVERRGDSRQRKKPARKPARTSGRSVR